MSGTDHGPLPGALGRTEPAGDELHYVVAPGDTATAIASRFGREPWQLVDEDGKLVQWIAGTDVRPLEIGERLRLTDLGFVETLDAGAGMFGHEDEDGGRSADELILPPADPRFALAFDRTFYEDQTHEFAPFGSDEGWHTIAELVLHHPPLTTEDTVRALAAWVWEDDDIVVDEVGLLETEETDASLIAVAFALLRTTGRLDPEGQRLLVAALERQHERFGEDVPDFARMLTDLDRFPAMA